MPEKNGNSESAALTFERPVSVSLPIERKPAIERGFGPMRRKRRTQWLLAGAVIFLLLCGGAYLLTRHTALVHYITAAATRGPVARAVSASGTVNPILTIIVGSYVSGVITEQYADYNTQVKKGQLCAKIDPRPYQTVVDQNRADLATAKAQLQKDKAVLAYAKLTYERDTELLKRRVVSQDTFDNAHAAYDQAQAQIDVDQATIQQREASLQTAQVNLDYTDIISPVDGTVVSRNITIGQTVAASFQTPTLFLIATDLTKMQVDTNVSESDVGGVKEGDKATFTVEAYPNRPFNGTVVQVRQAPQTVQNVVTYDIVVGFDNSEHLLVPGMTATTRIITDQRNDVLRVPNRALRFSPGGLAAAPEASNTAGSLTASHSGQSEVWLLKSGHPVRVPLELGLDDDTYTEVLQGDLKPGDQVIIGEQSGEGSGKISSAPRRFGF
jgi:HlyD family secretion protein